VAESGVYNPRLLRGSFLAAKYTTKVLNEAVEAFFEGALSSS